MNKHPKELMYKAQTRARHRSGLCTNSQQGQRNCDFDANVRFYKGSTPKIGVTLSLPNERVSPDKGFEFFQDELETYILRKLKNPTDIVTVTDLVDPTSNFLSNKPKPAFDATQAAADLMKKAVNGQIAKQFAQRIDAQFCPRMFNFFSTILCKIAIIEHQFRLLNNRTLVTFHSNGLLEIGNYTWHMYCLRTECHIYPT